ncbi:MAG: ribosome silencing factor [Verrucomicrobiia bacterium]|jgi:ribosome-associated protein
MRKQELESKKLALLCGELAENKKAEDIVILDVRKLSNVTDYFVIASATTEPHLRAIADEILEKLWEGHGIKPYSIDGERPITWLVIDFIDVIVHIFRSDIRAHYDLEGLWGDAPRVRRRKLKSPLETTAKPKKRKTPSKKKSSQ